MLKKLEMKQVHEIETLTICEYIVHKDIFSGNATVTQHYPRKLTLHVNYKFHVDLLHVLVSSVRENSLSCGKMVITL